MEFRPLCFEGAPEDFFALERVELYNLHDDPGETINLAGDFPERVEELRKLIQRRFAAIEDRATDQEIPDTVRRELEALGYLAR